MSQPVTREELKAAIERYAEATAIHDGMYDRGSQRDLEEADVRRLKVLEEMNALLERLYAP